MVTRVSSFQFFQTGLNDMLRLTSDANEALVRLSSGKKVNNPSDDPVGMNGILNYTYEINVSAQYRSNIDYAERRLNQEEAAITGIENLLFIIKNKVLQGNNGAYSTVDRLSLAREIEERFNELVNIANRRDENGEYIFAGFQSETLPFVQRPGNNVEYIGDRGQREIRVGNVVSVATNDSGQDVFLGIANPYGDFSPTYTVSSVGDTLVSTEVFDNNYNDRVHITSATIADRGNYTPIATAAAVDTYTINFVDTNADEVIEVEVRDSTGTIVFPISPPAASTTITYEAGSTISFNNIEVALEGGNPQVGDSILLTPDDSLNLFDVIKDAIDWLKSPNGNTPERALGGLNAGTVLEYLDAAQVHNNSVRSIVGARMSLLETQKSYLLDYDIILQAARGRVEDLDIAEGISISQQTITVLQATQGVFSQLQQLTLFDYIF